jgi:hypothetical protein
MTTISTGIKNPSRRFYQELLLLSNIIESNLAKKESFLSTNFNNIGQEPLSGCSKKVCSNKELTDFHMNVHHLHHS